MSVRAARILAVSLVVMNSAPALIYFAEASPRGPPPLIPLAPWGVAMGASLLASCRSERDVHAGRHAAWAYPWDWIQLPFLLLAAVAGLVYGRSRFLFVFSGAVALMFALTLRAMLLRRRRARAVWTTDAVRKTFE